MTAEQSFFLSVLADHLNKRKTAKPAENIDWKEVLALGKIHQVGGILYYHCQEFLPEDIQKQLFKNYGATLYSFTNRRAMVGQLEDALNDDNIPHFIIKGAVVATYYPVPALRTMGDTDLVVHTEDRLKAHEILLSLGFENESHFEDREWVYYNNGMEFELHDYLVYNETINRPEHEEYFNNFWQYVHDGELDWNFHFLFLLLHLRKHLMNEGVGFRQFMDIAVVMENCAQLNWVWIEGELKKLGMLDFARTVFAMNQAWFESNVPIPAKKLDADFYEEATETVFSNGVFGFDNAENRDNGAVNIARKAENAKLAMTRSAAGKVFPSYQTLITVPHYSFLRGKPWLLPAAWAYRAIRGIRSNRVKEYYRFVSDSFASAETIEKRSEFLNKWGL